MSATLLEEVSEKEVLVILNSIHKSNSFGLNGFLVVFYLGLYDLIEEDLLNIVKESQCSSKVLGLLNCFFLCHIPKSQEGSSFVDYRLNACCNLIYKFISEIITRKIKISLGSFIFED